MKLPALLLTTAGFFGPAGYGDVIGRAPATAAHIENPLVGDAGAVRAGQKLYLRECSACHGKEREGMGNAPALGIAAVAKAAPGKLFWVLRNGSLAHGMPSFAHLPDQQRWQLISYLQSGD